jgi:hypothetical protein
MLIFVRRLLVFSCQLNLQSGDRTFHFIAMLADQGEFHSYLPEDNLILVQIP